MRSNNELLAVLVLYKTRLEDSKTFVSLTASLRSIDVRLDLVVYNNSPDDEYEGLADHPDWHINYIADSSNNGVSKAYNTAAEIALRLGKKWLLLLDQDTIFPMETIASYLKAIEAHPDKQLIAPLMRNKNYIISPCRYKLMRGTPLKHIAPGMHSFNGLSLINCGLCIAVSGFQAIKGYNELLPLDFSDHDFIRRFQRKAAKEFVLIDLKVVHELSSHSKNSLVSDLVRFRFYLSATQNMPASVTERLLLKSNALVRSLKLSLLHRNLSFFKLWWKQ